MYKSFSRSRSAGPSFFEPQAQFKKVKRCHCKRKKIFADEVQGSQAAAAAAAAAAATAAAAAQAAAAAEMKKLALQAAQKSGKIKKSKRPL